MKRLGWCWIALACACGQTEGQSISLTWNAAKASDDSSSFATDTGWQVTLEEARVALESVFAIAPPEESAGAIARLERLLVPVAHAHGGHDEAGGLRVRAELLEPSVVDLLAGSSARLGNVSAEAGDVSTIKLELAHPDTRLPESMHGFQAYVRGSAERDGERISFAGGLHVAAEEPARRIETKVKFALSEGGALTLATHGQVWLRDAEFDRLPEAAAADQAREITPDSQVGRAWAIGVRDPDAFDLTWTARKD